MKKLVIMGLLVGAAVLGFTNPASAQVIPSVRGLTAFTPQTNFMSLPGYLRWQYFVENSTWITYAEASQLVSSQNNPT